jgi:hypothetical protein
MADPKEKAALSVAPDHAHYDAIKALLEAADKGQSGQTLGEEAVKNADARRKAQGGGTMLDKLRNLATGR